MFSWKILSYSVLLFWINIVNSLTYTKKNQGSNYLHHKEKEIKNTSRVQPQA